MSTLESPAPWVGRWGSRRRDDQAELALGASRGGADALLPAGQLAHSYWNHLGEEVKPCTRH